MAKPMVFREPKVRESDETKPISTNMRRILTVLLYFAYYSFGAAIFTFGPAWPDLGEVLNLTSVQMSYGLTVKFIASAVGAIACGVLSDLMNRTVLLVLANFMAAISVGITPFLPSMVGFLANQVSFGFATGIIDVICNVWLLELWAGTSNAVPVLQGLQLSFGLAALASPLIVQPFLSVGTTTAIVAAGELVNITRILSTGVTTESEFEYDTLNLTGVAGNSTDNVEVHNQSYVQIPLMITACLLAITGLVFIPTIRKKPTAQEVHEIKPRSQSIISHLSFKLVEPQRNAEPVYIFQEASKMSKFIILTLILLILFFWVGMATCNFGYLMTFLISTDLMLPRQIGAHMNSAMGGAYAAGRVLGVGMAFYVKPVYVVFGDLIVIALSNATFYYYLHTSETALWIGSLLLGIGFSTMYGNLFSLAAELIKVTNKVGAAMILTGVVSSAIYPIIVGKNIEQNPIVLINLNILSVMAVVLLLISLLTYVKLKRKYLGSALFS